eukprot:scaffold2070_cov105-Cylindrotheca_fusiformis.AAC.10
MAIQPIRREQKRIVQPVFTFLNNCAEKKIQAFFCHGGGQPAPLQGDKATTSSRWFSALLLSSLGNQPVTKWRTHRSTYCSPENPRWNTKDLRRNTMEKSSSHRISNKKSLLVRHNSLSIIVMLIRRSTPTVIVAATNLLSSLSASKVSAFIPFHPIVIVGARSSCCSNSRTPVASPVTNLIPHHQSTIPNNPSRLFFTTDTKKPAFNMAEEEEEDGKNKKTIQDVLDLWYPPPSPDHPKGDYDYLNDMSYIQSRIKDWFMGGDEMDAQCREFRDLIRNEAANNDETSIADMTMSECSAKIILFDQVTRNAFRREDEAFAYEELVEDILKKIFQIQEGQTSIPDQALSEFVDNPNVQFPDAFFVAVACEHQETPIFFAVDSRMYAFMEEKWPDLKDFLKMAKQQSEEHQDVLKRFGRYPHRNARKGREDTPEEKEWLNDYDNLPEWAKSQLPSKS